MKLLIATNNAGKVREFKELLRGIYDEVVSLKDEGIQADVVEDGKTFLENARKKAGELSKLVDCDVLADDSGLCVDGLDGAPGIYSARYAGEPSDDKKNNQKLILEIQGLSKEQRKARFVCALSLYRGGKELLYATGECEGRMIDEERGNNGFGYDPLFYVEEYGKTFAQLDAEIKNQISHRARALKMLKEKLEE